MLTDILERQRKAGFAGFRGATIKGRLPLREKLLNEAVLEATQGRAANSPAINRITVIDNNIVIVNVTAKILLFTQTLNLELAIDPIIDFPRDPYLRVRPARSLGVLGVLIDLFSAAFPLPAYATFAGQVFTLNLRDAMKAHGYAEYIPFVQYLGITTQAGTLNIDFRLAVS